MSELEQLYQQVIIDHGRSPRNFRVLSPCTHIQKGFNPLCGDRIELALNEKNSTIDDIAFQGSGCAISMASASLMTEILKGKSFDEAKKMFDAFHALLTKDGAQENIGKLAVLAGVKAYPMRVKCATLAWHTLMAALNQNLQDVITTEKS